MKKCKPYSPPPPKGGREQRERGGVGGADRQADKQRKRERGRLTDSQP